MSFRDDFKEILGGLFKKKDSDNDNSISMSSLADNAKSYISSAKSYISSVTAENSNIKDTLNDFIKRKEGNKECDDEIEALIADAKACFADGYFESGINIIDNAITYNKDNDFSPKDTVRLYNILISFYKKIKDNKMLNITYKDMLSYLEPYEIGFKKNILNAMYELYKNKQLKIQEDYIYDIASFAYDKGNYDDVIRILVKFVNENKNCPTNDLNYLLLGKVLLKQGKIEKSYRLLSTLVKKYPNSKHIMKIKSAITDAKKQLLLVNID